MDLWTSSYQPTTIITNVFTNVRVPNASSWTLKRPPSPEQ